MCYTVTNMTTVKQKIAGFLTLEEYRKLKSALALKGWTFSQFLSIFLNSANFNKWLNKQDTTDIIDTDIIDNTAI